MRLSLDLGLDSEQGRAEGYSKLDLKVRMGVFSKGSLTHFQMQYKWTKPAIHQTAKNKIFSSSYMIGIQNTYNEIGLFKEFAQPSSYKMLMISL